MGAVGRATRYSSVYQLAPRKTGRVGSYPIMRQITSSTTPLVYEFPMGIASVSHESPSVNYEEISRPLLLPILDTSTANLQKVSIQFMVVVPSDSIEVSIDDQISILNDFASEDDPVIFGNVHQAMSGTWRITSLNVDVNRVVNDQSSSRATQASATMSLTEYVETTKRFLRLPKFSYSVPKGRNTGNTGQGNADPTGDVPYASFEAFRSRIYDAGSNVKFISEKEQSELKRLAALVGDDVLARLITEASKTTTDRSKFLDVVVRAVAGIRATKRNR